MAILNIITIVSYNIGVYFFHQTISIGFAAVCIMLSPILLWLVRTDPTIELASYFLATCSGLAISYLLYTYTHGPNAGELFYMNVLPAINLFILGKRKGLFATILFLVFAVILLQARSIGNSFQLVISSLIVTFIVYFYQNGVETGEKLIQERTAKITNSLQLLKQNQKELEDKNLLISQREQKLTEQKDELERMNKLMIGREVTMVELKNKIKELESRVPPPLSS